MADRAKPADDFEDLADFLVVEPKTLPINGVRYDFPGDVSARAYLLMQHVLETGIGAAAAEREGRTYNAKELVLDDTAELDLRAEVFGDCAQEMRENEVSAAFQNRAFHTLMVWHVMGRDAALSMWRSGGGAQGGAPAPNRAARRSASKATATSTPRRASTSGTPSRRASATAKTPAPSRGRGSSPTGR